MRLPSPMALTAASAAAVCISVSPVPPDFEIAMKRVVASGSFSSSIAVGRGIEVVHEVHARRRPERVERRARPRRQAARSSGHRDSSRRCRAPPHRSRPRAAAPRRARWRRDRRSSPAGATAGGFRRRVPCATRRAPPRCGRPPSSSANSVTPCRADVLGARVVDVLLEGHPATLLYCGGKVPRSSRS